jgi:hypothetical protein
VPNVKEIMMRLLRNYGTIVWAIFRGGELGVSLKNKSLREKDQASKEKRPEALDKILRQDV